MRHRSQTNKTEKTKRKSDCDGFPTRATTGKVCRIATLGCVCWAPGSILEHTVAWTIDNYGYWVQKDKS